jgi:peptidyl-prolyl cis-trans isomerase D
LFNNGQLIDKAAYEQALADKGMTIPEFEAILRKLILMGRLQNLAMQGIVVTPQEIQTQFEKVNLKIKVEYIAFKPDNLKSAVTVTPEDIQKYYQSNQHAYMEPEKRNLALLIADQEDQGHHQRAPRARLRQAYSTARQYHARARSRTPHRTKTTDGGRRGERRSSRKPKTTEQLKAGADFLPTGQKLEIPRRRLRRGKWAGS